MAFDQATRNKLQKYVSDARTLLTEEFSRQLQNDYGMDPDTGTVSNIDSLPHLTDSQHQTAKLLRETMAHYQTSSPASDLKEILGRIVREQAFTVLNRLCALRMAEARGILIESVAKGYNSKGFQLYARVAKTALGETGNTYRNYLFSVFDEFSIDLAVLFDRYSPMGRLFPKETALLALLDKINDIELESLWEEDETIGWIYQYFNSKEERKKMRDESQAPRNSRELAVRNQFFTPRYVVEFLTDNTLGRIWYEMTKGNTVLKDQCRYLVRRPNEIFLQKGEKAPEQKDNDADLSQEELLRQPVYIEHHPIKDPRKILMLDPACGSMHFGLYAFDLFEKIYEEAWDLQSTGQWQVADNEKLCLLTETYKTRDELLQDIPRLIIENNIHGIDIDPRAVQIAGLSLWLRAQRSWKEQNVKPVDRPQIRKSNIVCAEPMPGEKEFLQAFSEQMKPRVLGQLVEIIFEKMELAGEAGSLLKIEEEIEDAVNKAREEFNKELLRRKEEADYLPGFAPINQQRSLFDFADLPDKTQFWQTAEEKILEALQNYAEHAEDKDGGRLRLFAEDAAKGFAFIDLCRKRYDVVLMNPPFGEAAEKTFYFLNQYYRDWNNNILCSFIDRAYSLLSMSGSSGVIYDRTAIIKSTYENFRKTHLISDNRLRYLVDLGWNVLDANVEVTTTILSKILGAGVFIDLREDAPGEKENVLKCYIKNIPISIKNNKCSIENGLNFWKFPNAVIGYDFPAFLRNAFSNCLSISANGFTAYQGHALKADKHFRVWWEISPHKDKKFKARMFNGSGFEPYKTTNVAVIISPVPPEKIPKDTATVIRNGEQHLKKGVCFGKRCDIFCAHVLPENHIFTVEGQSFPIINTHDALMLLGFLNTPLVRYSLNRYCGQHKYSGYVNLLPFKPFIDPIRVVEKVKETIEMRMLCERFDEISSLYNGIVTCQNSIEQYISLINNMLEDAITKIHECEQFCQADLEKSFSLSESELELISVFTKQQPEIRSPISDIDLFVNVGWFTAHTILSYCHGTILGRWDIRYATGVKEPTNLPDPFAPLPTCSPCMLQNADGLPAEPNDVLSDYPLRISWSGITVDDEGHPEDIIARVREAIEVIWKDKASDIEQEACEILGVRSLREYFAKPGKFFADHLKRYSKSRRQAPIYWPLSTPSGSYTLWLYYHRLTDQILYTCVNNFVGPKLKLVVEDVERLRKKTNRSGQEEKDLEKLSDLALELKDFQDDLLRIAKFWKPNLNDGVQITAAPLWKLFQYKPWHNTLKQTWEELEKGKYDWAHLAYSIWPERVIRASHKDRSYAIAHDLEADLWEEVETGTDKKGNPKTKWAPKDLSEKQFKQLIAIKTGENI
ncbi:MAG: BREX-1 system adenine-specific DNA-methyltransferase PglX [Desulfobacterales bacterium]